jgi:hypothetical protein
MVSAPAVAQLFQKDFLLECQNVQSIRIMDGEVAGFEKLMSGDDLSNQAVISLSLAEQVCGCYQGNLPKDGDLKALVEEHLLALMSGGGKRSLNLIGSERKLDAYFASLEDATELENSLTKAIQSLESCNSDAVAEFTKDETNSALLPDALPEVGAAPAEQKPKIRIRKAGQLQD